MFFSRQRGESEEPKEAAGSVPPEQAAQDASLPADSPPRPPADEPAFVETTGGPAIDPPVPNAPVSSASEQAADADGVPPPARSAVPSGPAANSAPASASGETETTTQNGAGSKIEDGGAIAELQKLHAPLQDAVNRLTEASLDRGRLERMIESLSNQNRVLSERHVLHEIVYQAARCLTAVADRIRGHLEQIERAVRLLPSDADAHFTAQLSAMHSLIQSNLRDVEITLNVLGVDTYQVPGDVFDPSAQAWQGQRPTPEAARHGHIAARLSPGYRRGDYVIRPERVLLWAFDQGMTRETGV